MSAALGCGAGGTSGQDVSSSTLADADDSGGAGFEAGPFETLEAGPDQLDAGSEADASGALVILPAQFTEEQMPMRMLGAGDPVDLWNAPQGGHVVLLGAKVKNLTSDTATLKVRFRRPDTGLIVAEEGRTVKMVPVPDEPGVMQPDLRSRSQVSNVPLCPSYDHIGIVDESFDMEVMVTALYTDPVESGTTTLRVVASCSTPSDEAFCRCECEADYFLGKCTGGPRR
jgi:hypothetical protein